MPKPFRNAEPTLDSPDATPLSATEALISCLLEKNTPGPPSFST